MIGAIQNNYYARNNQKKNESPVFKGRITDLITSGIKKIENGGVLVDFLFVDLLGMVIPRTYQAFTRNREELDGKLNVKNGLEELIREIFSGPSMFVIPMAFIALSKKLFGEASKIQFKTLGSLTDSFGRVLNKGTEHGKLKEEFYRNIFSEAFDKHKGIKLENPVNIDEQVEKLVGHISKVENGEKTQEHISEIKKIVSDVNKSHGLHLDNSHNLTLKDGLTKEIGGLITDFVNYSKDVVGKVAAHTGQNKSSYLQKLHSSKVGGRKFIAVATFLSTSAFLYAIPIMYKRNKQFPGIDGLAKEENNSLAKPDNKSISFSTKDSFSRFIPTTSFTGRLDHKKRNQEQNNVSFGSNSSFINNLFEKLDFNGHSASYPILAFYTLGLMLGCRLFQARNSDERREVATRDFSGLITIVFAIPVLRNFTSTLMKKMSGVPISKILKSTKDYFNPTNKPFTFENISDVYSGVSKYKKGIVDFAENIDNHGGNLRKVFDFLSDESKKALNTIAQRFSGKNTQVKSDGFLSRKFKAGKSELNLPETNEQIIEILKKAQTDDKFKPQLETITNELDKEKNPLVKFAEAQKSIPEAISIVAVSGFLGWFLPWFNINYTKKLYKNKENGIIELKTQEKVSNKRRKEYKIDK